MKSLSKILIIERGKALVNEGVYPPGKKLTTDADCANEI